MFPNENPRSLSLRLVPFITFSTLGCTGMAESCQMRTKIRDRREPYRNSVTVRFASLYLDSRKRDSVEQKGREKKQGKGNLNIQIILSLGDSVL
jgi:hypothetical protein